jgi:hypothetical protein
MDRDHLIARFESLSQQWKTRSCRQRTHTSDTLGRHVSILLAVLSLCHSLRISTASLRDPASQQNLCETETAGLRNVFACVGSPPHVASWRECLPFRRSLDLSISDNVNHRSPFADSSNMRMTIRQPVGKSTGFGHHTHESEKITGTGPVTGYPMHAASILRASPAGLRMSAMRDGTDPLSAPSPRPLTAGARSKRSESHHRSG